MRITVISAVLVGIAGASQPLQVVEDVARTVQQATHHEITMMEDHATNEVEPCAQVSQMLPLTKGLIKADTALACLRSVPLDKDGGAVQLKGIRSFAEFQSTLAYLKVPTPGYLYPAVDVLGGLDTIASNLRHGKYTNEYDFQLAIYKLIACAHDGHFLYAADILTVFGFARGTDLISLSSNGVELPETYLGSELASLLHPNASSSAVSPIAKINGVAVEDWLNTYATDGNSQDPDANYNAIFPIIPQNSQKAATGSGSSDGSFPSSILFQGNDTVITFANGTTQHVLTVGVSSKDFTGITNGKAFFKKFCTGTKPASSTTSPQPSSSAMPTPATTQQPFVPLKQNTTMKPPQFYPKAVILASDYSIGGYFPDSDDTLAVLSVPTFEPEDPVEFQNVIRRFLATCHAQGKKKLVIDLRGNYGGIVLLGYDLFTQLFPKKTPYGGTNFRAQSLFNDAGKLVSAYYKNVTDATATEDDLYSEDYLSVFNYKYDLTAINTEFKSWSEFYGPHQYHGDQFTSINRWDIFHPLHSGNIDISGYDALKGSDPITTFAPEDIVLVQDGACASTCTVFTEFMKSQAHVKQVTFGGRKQNGPMQGVGNVKGANIYGFSDISELVGEAFDDYTTPAQKSKLNKKYPQLKATTQQALKRAGRGGALASANVRNNIRDGDNIVTPLQFVYEAADCRLFYTAQQIVNQGLVWSAATDAIWGGAKCVAGSTGHPSSQTLVGANEIAQQASEPGGPGAYN